MLVVLRNTVLTLSTSDAEYVAMAPGAKVTLFAKAVLDFLQPKLVEKPLSCLAMIRGLSRCQKTQSVGGGRSTLMYSTSSLHQELVEREVLRIQYMASPLGLEVFARFPF